MCEQHHDGECGEYISAISCDKRGKVLRERKKMVNRHWRSKIREILCTVSAGAHSWLTTEYKEHADTLQRCGTPEDNETTT
jgi:hypothetical protein